MNAIMTIRNTTQKGKVQTNQAGEKYILMWNETQYCFPQEIWDIIKEYMGFIPNFPADFGAMYTRYEQAFDMGKVSDYNMRNIQFKIKRELKYYSQWIIAKESAYLSLCTGDYYIPDKEVQEWRNNRSLKYSLLYKAGGIKDIYETISQPFSFLHCRFKVGDKVLLNTASPRLLFKKGGDKDNVVPTGDYDNAVFQSKDKDKSRFTPINATDDGEGDYNYVPAIITSITALKVKMNYYNYNLTEQEPKGLYTATNTYDADWSAPRGKITCGWGSKQALLSETIITKQKNVDRVVLSYANYPR